MKSNTLPAFRRAFDASRRGWSKSITSTGSSVTHVKKVLFILVLGAALIANAAVAGASSSADQGVTAKTINVGVPYTDFAALRSFGITLNESSSTDAYGALNAISFRFQKPPGASGFTPTLCTASVARDSSARQSISEEGGGSRCRAWSDTSTVTVRIRTTR